MSTLNVSNITDGTDTVETGYVLNGSAKAWINFADTSTATINNSLNMSSITDHASGQYSPYFTNSFNDHHYAAVGNAEQGSGDRSFEIRTTATNYYDMWLSVGTAISDNVINDASSTVTGDLA